MITKSKFVHTPGKDDMLIDRHVQPRGWVSTQLVRVDGEAKRAAFLVQCEVNDPNRFGYFNGSWWKLEDAKNDWDFET